MTPIREKVVVAKAGVIRDMMVSIATLPLETRAAFLADDRMVGKTTFFSIRSSLNTEQQQWSLNPCIVLH